MAEIHYLISDASKKVDVEAHVLRYWEEELELSIPRNDMGHRYYTDFHIRLFRQVKMLKEKGYQLKAVKAALAKSLKSDGKVIIPNEVLEEDVIAALKVTGIAEQSAQDEAVQDEAVQDGQASVLSISEDTEKKETNKSETNKTEPGEKAKNDEKPEGTSLTASDAGSVEALLSGEKMEQFQKVMNHIIGCAMEANSEKLSQDVSYLVHDKLMKEMDYLMRVADEKEEERFKQLDEVIRLYQKDGQGRAEAAAAASKLPFFRFKKKKFGRNGNKI